jgi:hypothetical protein
LQYLDLSISFYLFVEMEPSKKHALELALRYFYIPDHVHLSLNDRLRFNWLMQQPLATSWQFLTLEEFRPRESRGWICTSKPV